ncbi:MULTISPECIES: Csu type fimbrial protein [Acinetobacter]|uniref:Spore coat U domain-containing protein n=4 Tax=Acinetobacter TaxID=469 RepID=A0A7T7WLG0_9GAMM|nr:MULTISPECIES: spore coat U domain-containing protein [Acinetobacter]NHB65438.1 spore coat U domain-containing protein [Acinetobacter sp. GFQ9D191M]NHB98953.1 spore coat U domain-containing protein [Acinetobacter sp. GFQ9D192M]QQN89654.1 spore coat U domain-containing protein [Acinetobacter variabilis]WKT71854.1 spore coat U domain-containing protein [Acinetobacter variabilis]
MKIFKYSFVILAVVSVSAYTMSDRQSTQFQVKIKVNEICDIGTGSTSNIDFGTISRNTQNIQATGSLNVSCTNGTPYNISLNSDGTLKNTQDASLKLSYRLYQDASMSKEWGNSSENRFSQHGTGQTQNITIWGKVPDTNVPAGQYIDTVTATITY